jgi:hypothetical protein
VDQAELVRLQQIVIDNTRFTKMGYRQQEGFIGEHDRRYGTPIPEHLSARYKDLSSLMDGLIATDRLLEEDRKHYVSRGIIFPVSAIILERLDQYREVLESFSRPRLDLIEWRPTPDNNVEVLNETIDLYRYFDATRQAEFLYDCVNQTIERKLPEEILFLERYDRMKSAIGERFDMPGHTSDLLIRFLRQNHGVLSKRAREKEFQALTADECRELEELYAEISGVDSSD